MLKVMQTIVRTAIAVLALFLPQVLVAGGINYCNFASYDTEAVIVEIDQQQHGKLFTTIRLAAGACDEVWLPAQPNNNYTYYIRALDTRSLRQLQNDYKFTSDWGGWPIWTPPSSENPVCISQRDGAFIKVPNRGGCQGSVSAGTDLIRFDANDDFYIESIDPFLCERKLEINCWNRDARPVLEWAFQLNMALISAYRVFETQYSERYNHVIPANVGWDVNDHNGPYNLGVKVKAAKKRTDLRSPIFVQEGDIVLEFNGNPIFSRAELVHHAVEHGLKYGFANPHKVVVQRGGEIHTFPGFQHFNRISYGPIFQDGNGMCKVRGRAALSAALREALFYQNDIVGCIHFDRNLGLRRDRSCEFIVQQVVAAYSQFCPDVTFYSTIVGGVFMPGREIPESVLRRYFFKGAATVPRVLRAIVLESAEEAARAIQTLPPGIEALDNMAFIRDQAALGAALGVGFTVAFPKGLVGR